MPAYRHDDYASEFRVRASAAWDTVAAFAKKQGPPPIAPYQVEIHLSRDVAPVCLLRCIDCHGQFQRVKDGLTPATYLQLLDDLEEMDVQSVVLSGAYSDPSTDEQLLISVLDRAGPRWGVKLHTYGLGLTPAVRAAILRAAEAGPAGSYVTISRVTMDPAVYQRMCRPVGDPTTLLQRDTDNVAALFSENTTHPDQLVVRLNCRLTQLNRDPSDVLRWLMRVSDSASIRFTPDYVPTLATEHYAQRFIREVYLAPDAAEAAVEAAIAATDFPRARASFRPLASSAYAGMRCFSCLLLTTVSTGGLLLPCQGIASPAYQALAYGDLRTERFPAAWTRFTAQYHELPIWDCPRCVGACEQQLNTAMCEECE